MSEELAGPKKSKDAINALEEWLVERCKEPVKITDIEAKWQYITGHEPRKIRQYLKAIETSGHIKLYSNTGEKMVALSDSVSKREKKQKLTLAEIIDGRMKEDADFRAKMLAGPCAGGCPPGEVEENPDCSQCITFRSLRNKDFLKE